MPMIPRNVKVAKSAEFELEFSFVFIPAYLEVKYRISS